MILGMLVKIGLVLVLLVIAMVIDDRLDGATGDYTKETPPRTDPPPLSYLLGSDSPNTKPADGEEASTPWRASGPRARSGTAKRVEGRSWARVNLGCGNDLREGWVNVDQHRPRSMPQDVRIREPGRGLAAAKKGYRVFVQADVLDYLLDMDTDTLDRVLIDNVLEHLDRPLIVLREIARACKPGAVVTVRVPHKDAPGANILTHSWVYSRESLRPVLTNRGGLESSQLFELVERQVFRAFPGAWLLRDLTGLTLPFGRRQAIEWRLKVI